MNFSTPGFPNLEPKVPDRKEQIINLKESISKKIEYISRFRNEIDSPEIIGMSVDEFRAWTNSKAEEIFTVFPEQKNIIEQTILIKAEIDKLEAESASLNSKIRDIKTAAVRRYLGDDTDKIEQYLNYEIEAFESYSLEEEALTQEEKEVVDPLGEQEAMLDSQLLECYQNRDSIIKNDDTVFVSTALSFFQKISEKKEEVAKIKDSFEAGSLEGLLKYNNQLSEFINKKGRDIDIKFEAYDVVIYLSKEDVRTFFNENTSLAGWHFSNTPISFVINEDRTTEEILYTETHEKGHNRSECLQDAGINNIFYSESTIQSLRADIERYQSFKNIRVPGVVVENLLERIAKKIRSQIRYLNGEISADVENLVKGNFTSFYFHFLNTVQNLYVFINQSVSKKEDGLLFDLLKKEMNDLTTKAAEHVKNALFLSMVARKYHKEDEFFASVLMSPQSMRIAERYLREELGANFEFEKSFSALAPEYVLSDRLHRRVYEIHKEADDHILESIFSQEASRGIVPPENYVDKGIKSANPGRYISSPAFDRKFKSLFEVSSIFNPAELKKFIAFATPEKVSRLSESEKKQAIYTLEYAVNGNMFAIKLFNSFFKMSNPEEIREYAENIKKIFEIFGMEEKGKIFLQEIFETCFYNIFSASLSDDNTEPLQRFMEAWNGMEFELENYISDSEDSYETDLGVEDMLDDSNVEDELKNNIINNASATKVFQYIKSLK